MHCLYLNKSDSAHAIVSIYIKLTVPMLLLYKADCAHAIVI